MVGGVRPPVVVFHLRHEADETFAELGRRAAQDVFVQRHGESYDGRRVRRYRFSQVLIMLLHCNIKFGHHFLEIEPRCFRA